MAEDQDQSQKTEEPTQKRLEESHKKGDVAKSQEIKHWFMIGGGALILGIFATNASVDLVRAFRPYLESADAFAMDPSTLLETMKRLMGEVATALFVPLLVLCGAAVAGNMIQHKPIFSFEKIKPKLDKLSLFKGFKRLFSAHTTMEFLKSLLKLVLVGTVALMLVWPERDRLGQLMTYEIADVVSLFWVLAMRMFMGVIAVLGVIAAIDFLFQRLQFLKRQRMTKQEIKDEYKQLEGDPTIRARIRQIRMERARKRMMAQVPEASVVLTNPTHYSVALKYDGETMSAPRVVAKGADLIAMRIREVATEHKVPIVENPPLARALYATVELDQEIPSEHYKAVAEVIGYVMRLKRPKPPKRRAPA